MLRVGAKVKRVPETLREEQDGKYLHKNVTPIWGTVVYVHPLGRFHTVEFAFRGGRVRESFAGAR